MATLKLRAKGQTITIESDIDKIVENSIAYLKYEFIAEDSDWANSTPEVIFTYENVSISGPSNGEVPSSIIRSPGFLISVIGKEFQEEDEGIEEERRVLKRITTFPIMIKVWPSGEIEGNNNPTREEVDAEWYDAFFEHMSSNPKIISGTLYAGNLNPGFYRVDDGNIQIFSDEHFSTFLYKGLIFIAGDSKHKYLFACGDMSGVQKDTYAICNHYYKEDNIWKSAFKYSKGGFEGSFPTLQSVEPDLAPSLSSIRSICNLGITSYVNRKTNRLLTIPLNINLFDPFNVEISTYNPKRNTAYINLSGEEDYLIFVDTLNSLSVYSFRDQYGDTLYFISNEEVSNNTFFGKKVKVPKEARSISFSYDSDPNNKIMVVQGEEIPTEYIEGEFEDRLERAPYLEKKDIDNQIIKIITESCYAWELDDGIYMIDSENAAVTFGYFDMNPLEGWSGIFSVYTSQEITDGKVIFAQYTDMDGVERVIWLCVDTEGTVIHHFELTNQNYLKIENIDNQISDTSKNPVQNKVIKEYIDNSQDTMYTFSIADFEKKTILGKKIYTSQVTKQTITTKDGMPSNIPAMVYDIYLYTGAGNLITGEVTPLFDLPIIYNLKQEASEALYNPSIKNLQRFTPYITLPYFSENLVSMDNLIYTVSNFITNAQYTLNSAAWTVSTIDKIMGFNLHVVLEFINEEVRDEFYEEFSPVLKQVSHFYLKYENYKTVESSYIGGGDLYDAD